MRVAVAQRPGMPTKRRASPAHFGTDQGRLRRMAERSFVQLRLAGQMPLSSAAVVLSVSPWAK